MAMLDSIDLMIKFKELTFEQQIGFLSGFLLITSVLIVLILGSGGSGGEE